MFEVKDGYKIGHCKQYPKDTELVYSNLTARGSKIAGQESTVFFGLQYFIKKYLMEKFDLEFFKRPRELAIREFKDLMDSYLGPNTVDMKEINDLWNLGYLPILIKAVPEGMSVPLRVPMMTIRNTKPEFYWLTNALETILSTTLWLPITSATTSKRFHDLLTRWAEETGGVKDFVQFQGHDFSMRGMAGLEAAEMSGAAHLTSFVGTDTVPAIPFLVKYYNANLKDLIGCSVPATEHSVMCLYGPEDEIGTFKRLITEIYPNGIVSVVSDTWDFWQVVTEYLPKLKPEIMARPGKLVIRPDSGDPAEIVCGVGFEENGKYYKEEIKIVKLPKEKWIESGYASLKGIQKYWIKEEEIIVKKEISIAEFKGLIECLWDIFGGTVNTKGFKELDPHIGAIYGDAISYDRANEISAQLAVKGFASTNIVYGIGSYTYQYVTRDTYNMAVKTTYAERGNKPMEVYKAPKTDNGMKNSLKGLIKVYINESGDIVAKDQCTWEEESEGLLTPVFCDSRLVWDQNLNSIRERIKNS